MAIVDEMFGAGARWAFADRVEGSSLPPYDADNLADHVGDDLEHVAANRAALARAVGVGAGSVVAMAPVHGRGVGVVDGARATPVPEVDALVTTTPGIALLVVAADCVPVLLADAAAGVVAVVHAGWRGVRDDVVGATLETMTRLGASRIEAVVGPSVCGACYDVSQARFDEVVSVAPSAAATARGGGPALDLRSAVLRRLADSGVMSRTHRGCTVEDPTLFSFRRDGRTGRHGGVVTLVPR